MTPSEIGIVRSPRTLSITLTYQCPAACQNCGTFSGPGVKTHLSISAAREAIIQAADLGFANVVFTGGEPTLRWLDLLECIQLCATLNVPTRIVSNGHWATSLNTARTKISQLQTSGLGEINLSTGKEHIQFIPLERVITATVAALEYRLPTSVMIEVHPQRGKIKEEILSHPTIASLSDDGRKILKIIESPWMPLDPSEISSPLELCANHENVALKTGCDSVLQTYVLEADGRIASCCGLGMRAIPELHVSVKLTEHGLAGAIQEAENDFLKLWLRYKGPEKILAWASKINPNVDWENKYAHRCQACMRLYADPTIRKVVRENYREMLTDVIQAAYFDEVYVSSQLDSAPSKGMVELAQEVTSI